MKASNNYLALRDQNGSYYLNGNWRIDYPQRLDICGTTFHYERKYKNKAAKGPLTLFAPESVRALGPTTCSLFVVVSAVWLLSCPDCPDCFSPLFSCCTRRRTPGWSTSIP